MRVLLLLGAVIAGCSAPVQEHASAADADAGALEASLKPYGCGGAGPYPPVVSTACPGAVTYVEIEGNGLRRSWTANVAFHSSPSGCFAPTVVACDAEDPRSCIWFRGSDQGQYVDRTGVCHELADGTIDVAPTAAAADVGEIVEGTFAFEARRSDGSIELHGRFRACVESAYRGTCE